MYTMQKSCQKTIGKEVSLEGVALHSGLNVKLTLKPAPANTGVKLVRSDLPAEQQNIEVSPFSVVDTMLCSKLANTAGGTIGTVEHLMAALHSLGIDNIVIEANNEEIPVLDGSSIGWLELIDNAGVVTLDAEQQVLKVKEKVKVEEGARFCMAEPADNFEIAITIDYNHPNLPEESATYTINEQTFREDIQKARTFCLERDIEMMQKMGLIKGGSLENAVVFGENGVLNPEGVRYENPSEALRHKVLDCIGDLFLTGKVVQGKFTLHYPGHGLNNQLLRKIVEQQ